MSSRASKLIFFIYFYIFVSVGKSYWKNEVNEHWLLQFYGFTFSFKAALFYHFCLVAFDSLHIEFLQHFYDSIYLCSILGYVPQRKISNKFIRSKHLNYQFSVQWICWNKLRCSFCESLWSEQNFYAPIFPMYMTVAQRTREDVKY